MSPVWQASFVAAPAHASGRARGAAPYLRTEFAVDVPPRHATLHVTALGLIEPHVNGVRVSEEVLIPGWTSYRHRLAVSSADVTALVVPGRNALGAVLGEGWAVGRLTSDPQRLGLWADRPAAFLQLELDYGDRVELVTSDGNWRASTGAVLANSIYDGEAHDARLEPIGWSTAGFDDRAWSAVEAVDVDLDTLIVPSRPPIRRIEELPSKEIITTPSGRTIVDFGQNLAGWVRLTVTGAPGTTITLRHAETLTGGEANFVTNRGAHATDSYTLSGGGTETWEPRFTFHGFRYVDVEGWPGPLDPGSLTAVVVHSDMARTGWFETSHELINRLHRNVVWSMRGNFVGLPTDCPQRDERLGWTGDINAFGPVAVFLYDARGVLESWLEDVAAEQREKGFVPHTVPDALGTPSPPAALWSDVVVGLPWTLYWECGDQDVLARMYPAMTAFVDDVAARLDDRGLWNRGFQFGDWLDPDAPAHDAAAGKTDRYLVATAFFCRTTNRLARIAEILARPQDAARYAALHTRVREAFRHEWVTPAGLLGVGTATAYALAICFDLLDASQERRAGDQLADLVAKADYRITTGFAGTPFVTHALSRTNHLDTAYRLLLQTECPSFLYPVTAGATTMWERWDALLPDGSVHDTGMTSLNHYAFGAVADWLHQVVGGLSPAEPGYRRIRVAPRPGGGLTHATTTHDTPHGRIQVAWRRVTDHRMALEVDVPPGTSADVLLPEHPDHRLEQVGGGRHRWEYEVPASDPAAYDFDTPMAALAADPAVWAAVSEVLHRHLSQYAERWTSDAPPPQLPNLRAFLTIFAGRAPSMETDLVAALKSRPLVADR
ncbi:glycoside hydrolase family 78 protein [Frankia sp. CNm7]|uniref:alpha-L-rhamnosidase n=1 Tax=Frankia nepalensis TaxID=1836974 RepID=A0A937RKR5_9ACTN|nr:glycoside hydrolase family 78 protein [Frankia nepalensis]MBL7497365.1 glycoside hydrolase family 78 protein [Frankia nepalensis]MBL7510939.1 glycoside hydrolase family 78 protein [Frankia nepalensis]MBL7517259.1 glycoside hydrolase family 78 protein [Frankia nepalensis]MBL7631942.1 glycoside hydrolase family 78 protein [Frankia nepalensis]